MESFFVFEEVAEIEGLVLWRKLRGSWISPSDEFLDGVHERVLLGRCGLAGCIRMVQGWPLERALESALPRRQWLFRVTAVRRLCLRLKRCRLIDSKREESKVITPIGMGVKKSDAERNA